MQIEAKGSETMVVFYPSTLSDSLTRPISLSGNTVGLVQPEPFYSDEEVKAGVPVPSRLQLGAMLPHGQTLGSTMERVSCVLYGYITCQLKYLWPAYSLDRKWEVGHLRGRKDGARQESPGKMGGEGCVVPEHS